MATTSASCLKVKPLKDLEEIHALLREFQQFEVVIGPSEETFRLAGIADNELDDLCEVHISRIPNTVSLAQLVRLCISLNDSGGLASLVRLTLFINSSGILTGKATATYQNEEHAMSAELELNGAIISDEGIKRLKVKTENWVLQSKPPTYPQHQPPPTTTSASVASSCIDKTDDERTDLSERQSPTAEVPQAVVLSQDDSKVFSDATRPMTQQSAQNEVRTATVGVITAPSAVALATVLVGANAPVSVTPEMLVASSATMPVPSASSLTTTTAAAAATPSSATAAVALMPIPAPPLPISQPSQATPLEEGLIATTEMGRRLYVANIPKNKTQPDILSYFQRYLSGVVDVVLYTYPGSSQNRGFCFVEFTSTKKAMVAKDAIVAIRPWGCEVVVDWADPEQEPAEHVMKNVKVLYIKNIAPPTSEGDLRKAIEERGIEVERVKVIRDFGFVHFVSRERAEAAMEACRDLELDGQTLKV
ncbi:uncharacterized protein LOC111260577 isoform X2 [Varroa jacobsoni]|nr:uncharacterized protein LOC111244575 isoform X2 [Varroa destructor]XP_022689197.1 uncharacterized protein LOC111260577 isoform X2 [Varroa jacobsoni]